MPDLTLVAVGYFEFAGGINGITSMQDGYNLGTTLYASLSASIVKKALLPLFNYFASRIADWQDAYVEGAY